MRLSAYEIDVIKTNVLGHIEDAKIMLFGSRIDDTKKGGDIDIFIQTNKHITMKEQVSILANIELAGVLRKVDLILKTPNAKEQAIFKTALQEGIVL